MTSTAGRVDGAFATLGELREAQRSRHFRLLFLLGIALIAALGAGLATGPVPIGLDDVLAALSPSADDTQAAQIVRAIRLPRLVLGLTVGAVLGLCGAALQALLRNPLADPGIIGVSSGAALAAGLVIVTGGASPGLLGPASALALPLGSFLGSMAAIVSVYALSRRAGTASGATLILAGIAITALTGSALGYLTFISTDEQLRQLVFWTLGSLGRASWATVIPAATLMIVATVFLLRLAAPLNGYLLGEREAVHLGIDVHGVRRQVIVLTALGVGAAVAVTGIIGFIGLAAAHIVRLLAGGDHRVVLPGSALLGALLVVTADIVARTAVAPAELPIGILTSGLGGPFFLWLLGRYRRELF